MASHARLIGMSVDFHVFAENPDLAPVVFTFVKSENTRWVENTPKKN